MFNFVMSTEEKQTGKTEMMKVQKNTLLSLTQYTCGLKALILSTTEIYTLERVQRKLRFASSKTKANLYFNFNFFNLNLRYKMLLE
ncbi:hypothetical protein SPOG_05231 [Schizosaccharomyces cryophilus OY26]|uniref:Uncharacterized protein n=1 Tax=Schizosaccharomyces cryophilus (strain OY26 / ATCC MYA-4695 / CBS 11777 / NBRC 106824 / NRRL Y48691) TaxID=653667 RepID=S9WXP0_SCHCR|nr:uncharacterized protein SPOG_05231 [Schizosaccharomyces cryophilus OY26]EPY49457.1 hypothetical protein SPOG_05231 [Schizosaccharomyces cryophilus OY26]